MYSIQTRDLTKVFKKKRHRGIFGFLKRKAEKEKTKENRDVTVALDHVNVKIRSGELFGLLGPNGAAVP